MAREEVKSAEVWQYEKKGDEIEGVLLSRVMGSFEKNDYTLLAPSGNEFIVFGTAVLETAMKKIKDGEYIFITYLGMEKTKDGKRDFKNFKVDRDPEKSKS